MLLCTKTNTRFSHRGHPQSAPNGAIRHWLDCQFGEPVVTGEGVTRFHPLDQQPFGHTLKMALRLPALRRPRLHLGKA
jgi:hypothetical protein